MRAIFLNTWYAKVGVPFWKFIEENSATTDIFCLQEVEPKQLKTLSGILKDHKVFFESAGFVKEMKMVLGQAILAHKSFSSLSSGRVFTFRKAGDDAGFFQYLELELKGKTLFVGNIHGKAYPGDKLDTRIRLRQSERVLNFLRSKTVPKIIGGDFNLMPQTKSIEMFEAAGYRNLIKDFKIKNTRNRISWRRFHRTQHFSDYVFVSPEIKAKNFSAPYIEISDHLPLILDFEV